MQNLQPRFHKNEKLLQVALGSQMNYHMLIILQSFFAGSNEFPRKNNNGQAEKRRLPLADIGNISSKKNRNQIAVLNDHDYQERNQNQMLVFNDQNFMKSFFSEFSQKNSENQQKTIENNQIIVAREQNLRREEQNLSRNEQELRKKDQDLLKSLVESLCTTNKTLLDERNKP